MIIRQILVRQKADYGVLKINFCLYCTNEELVNDFLLLFQKYFSFIERIDLIAN